MVKHIVLYRLHQEADGRSAAENAQLMKQKLEDLNGRIDGLLHLEIGINFNPKGLDVALYSEFRDQDALAGYIDHPLHLAVRSFVHLVMKERYVVDFEA